MDMILGGTEREMNQQNQYDSQQRTAARGQQDAGEPRQGIEDQTRHRTYRQGKPGEP